MQEQNLNQENQNQRTHAEISKTEKIVIAIVAVILGVIFLIGFLSYMALENARIKSRDAKRISDIKQMQTAFELYYSDENHYPSEAEFQGEVPSKINDYIHQLPSNPLPNDGLCFENFEYEYKVKENGKSYELIFCIGHDVAGLNEGYNVATPSGMDPL